MRSGLQVLLSDNAYLLGESQRGDGVHCVHLDELTNHSKPKPSRLHANQIRPQEAQDDTRSDSIPQD